MSEIRLTGGAEVSERLRRAGRLQSRMIQAIANEVVRLDKAHVHTQTDINDRQFAPRKQGRRKMEVKLGRLLSVIAQSQRDALIGWRVLRSSQIAARQQLGLSQTVSLAQFKAGMPTRAGNQPATRSQAKALLDVGFKRRLPGGRRQTPSKKWITENLNVAQAGAILKALRVSAALTAWQVSLPPRAFLGVSTADYAQLKAYLLEQMRQELAG